MHRAYRLKLSLIQPEQLALNFEAAPSIVPQSARTIVAEQATDEIASNHELIQTEVEGFSLAPQVRGDGQLAPIPYQLKVSSKARQVYLRVEPGRGLQVTIPKRYAKRSIPDLVESQRQWITEALVDLDDKTPAIYRQWPPPQLLLSACETMVDVTYIQKGPANDGTDTGTASWESPNRLNLVVDVNNKPLVASCIASALKPRANALLGPWLAHRAARSQLHYKRMSIRGQRTVWGSYSSSGTLSLNYKLVFLHRELVDYVLLHELAHTRYLDHSTAFWRFLDKLKPNAVQFDRELKEAGSQVPPWLELVGSP